MSKNNSKNDVVYIDLDCLLDTRLGTLILHNEELAEKALEDGYECRDRDEFEGITYDQFKELYAKRNVETLQVSTFTNIFLLLMSIIKNVVNTNIGNSGECGVEFIINTYPYELSVEEKQELTKAVQYRINNLAPVTVGDMNNLSLTPSYCGDNFDLMIRYDYNDWLHMHFDAFQEKPIPKVTLIAPALYSTVPTEAEFAEMKNNNQHPIRSAEIILAPIIGLKLFDAELFSIYKGINPSDIDVARAMHDIDDMAKKYTESKPKKYQSPESDDELL